MATILHLLLVFLYLVISHIIVFLSIGFDLNLPLDEYGAINFDFEENLAGKINFFLYDSMLVIKIVGLNLLVFFATRRC